MIPTLAPGRTMTFEGEGQRLWNQLTKGMDGIYRVAQDYADIGLQGDPVPQLLEIYGKMGTLIKQLQERTK